MPSTLERPLARRPEPTPAPAPVPEPLRLRTLLPYLLLGVCFGIVLVKSEVASWFRIQEMLRFREFHLFAVLGSAVLVAGTAMRLIRRHNVRTLGGEPIVIPPKAWGRGSRSRYWLGGTLFGLGWTLTGTCPGSLYALLGAGVGSVAIVFVTAVAGVWVYGALRPKLPH
jgi:uncharacterized membrane protein YedE/YeeE